MTNRTKIERVGGHLLIEGGSYTGEDNCQDVALPVATLRVENRNAREVFIWAEGDPLKVPNVIAHGWTAREILEVAYGPQVDTEKAIADLRATVKVQHDRIKVLEEALLKAEYVLGQIDADDEVEATLRKVCDALAPARVRAGLTHEAAGVER